MICISACVDCIHRRDYKKDGWIPTCDAFPDGMPLDFDIGKVKELKECNNGIGYEEAQE